ncbi:MAG: sulfite exporter TauE/SafE family protein [Deferribacteres bacterium]|nr:sulfite exporter TauE/SafE family protein [candidate division KSB1 bacterium]MCB9502329.1 sulfite exporter TauE/SafE family protein [Deferribacteres bacterium]
MFIMTALVLGLVGGFHCVGMCGPLVLALPGTGENSLPAWTRKLFYNFGRAFTYALMGFVMGIIGQAISLAGFQRALSIILGVTILIIVFIPSRYTNSMTSFFTTSKIWKKTFGRLLQKQTIPSFFIIGVLNGFLPCGLVYTALAGAVATGSIVNSTIFMIVFGLGTAPMLLLTSLLGGLLSVRWKSLFNRLIPIAATALAVILILRGLSLGIPFLSPVLQDSFETVNKTMHMH